ncbi:dephospho-CoA kinase [Candidatus Kinetoplastibacterium blastocrithidii TCC012E]|uniref:Dephospho-CoA kinase n=2 Tax=cellular organisms TaxID=131567 RepID=S9VRH8_9TRYP|nr:dephospho-CoA kinase [Candidatus Kinetoplastibacterium blastocrithidii]AFZ83420.1 dephospho-CoA kinase [Candidatus Kinetoplastibacterium blastocrithidii (ex Strigomonas culicis)]AGF49516.1 dephospho-CoA kinase [Candidatus Kinetoplastibacterium blastocrithidii TCC012E]EPY25805.1 dephospho-CoA kinase [Strigomonas culicis]EPY33853.1 dephospho-CoA kinase [Strigomonas culicis]|eukprot:EPY25805.1 dephospho-CoA kinase [Strigomonas culicis]
MLKIGLTGGIGSGKTLVSCLLRDFGAYIIDTDEIAKSLTNIGGEALPKIVKVFGKRVIGSNGLLDRSWLREQIFYDNSARASLESIMHPLISYYSDMMLRQYVGLYVVFVVPLLVETTIWLDKVNRVCVVDCDKETQIRRLSERNLSLDMIKRIISIQSDRYARLKFADDIIMNDSGISKHEVFKQVKMKHNFWYMLSKKFLV